MRWQAVGSGRPPAAGYEKGPAAMRGLFCVCASGDELDRIVLLLSQEHCLLFGRIHGSAAGGRRHPVKGGGISLMEVPGGAERDRTADLVIANDALSQLSYSPQGGVPISGPFTLCNAF